MLKKIVSLAAVVLLTASCAGQNSPAVTTAQPTQAAQVSQPTKAPASQSPQTTAPAQPAAPASKSSFPITDKPLTLRQWRAMGKSASILQDYNEMAAFKLAEKATGIHIEFLHPPVGQEKDQFNLMVASKDMPDMVWSGYFSSNSAALANDLIIPLNDYLDDYAPNYKKILDANPLLLKAMTTDEGEVAAFAYTQLNLENVVTEGNMIRLDWLNKLNLAIPETLDEWEVVLTAFKEKDPGGTGKVIPFDGAKGKAFYNFGYAYGIKPNDFYVAPDDTVRYGPYEPGFKDFITKMNDWYNKGLINQDYLTSDSKLRTANMTSNRTGSFYGAMSGDLGNFTSLMVDDPNFLIWPVAWPKLNKDSVRYVEYGRAKTFNGGSGYVCADSKHKEESVRWFDWGYTEEGSRTFNFGEEGVTYTLVEGKPVFTDVIMNNSEGLSINNALAKYTLGNQESGFVQNMGYIEQIVGATPAQRQALRVWSSEWPQHPEHNLALPGISLNDEERSRDSSRMNDIKTYMEEMLDKFIIGQESLANYDKFVAQLKTMGIEDSIKIRQAAYERWKDRGGVPSTQTVESANMSFKNSKLVVTKGIEYLDSDLK